MSEVTEIPGPDWQPIETAPRNQYVRLRFGDDEGDEDGIYVGILYDWADHWIDRTGSDYGYGFSKPTEWALNDSEGEM